MKLPNPRTVTEPEAANLRLFFVISIKTGLLQYFLFSKIFKIILTYGYFYITLTYNPLRIDFI